MKKISALLIFLICVLIVFSRENNLFYRGWSKIHNKPEPIKGHEKDSLPWTSYKDVSYGNDEQQKMDVYLPLVRNSKTRMMIIIHGGGWYQGDKSEFDSFVDEFQKRLPGYAFANVNYRLVKKGGNYFPTQENDIKSAIEFLKNKSPEYNISTDYILLGQSAGAQLALLQGYKHSDIVQPKGIISFFGPVDLTFLYKNSDSAMSTFLQTTMNATPEGNPAIFAESSPLNFITSKAAPTLIFHGDKDKIIPVDQAYLLRDKLAKAGVINKLVVYPGKAHGWTGDDLADSFQQAALFIKGLDK